VLARVIPADGRSRAYVNGRLATASTLAEEGARLVDLHGQHAHQSLLSMAVQRAALDRFGSVDLRPLREARGRLTEIDAALASLGGDVRARAREIDLLRFQVDELAAAALHDPEEDAELSRAEDLLAGAVAHRESAARAADALGADDGALDRIGSALAALAGRTPFVDLDARLRALAAEADDVASELRRRGEAIDDDPARLDEVRARRQLLRELRRKYGESVGEVMAYRDEVAARLAELALYESRVEALEAQRLAALAAETAAAGAVGQARRTAAPALAKAVAGHLAQLAMPRARVEVVVGDDPGDEVMFLLGANPGEPALPLAKVASGGELARTMLALRLVLTEAPETLVFDEVDAGIGGEAARAIGAALAALGRDHQVLVVTHFAQVAASATTQVAVVKTERAGRTLASASIVANDARVRELSRMLSGLADSSSARQHAQELLADAHQRSA